MNVQLKLLFNPREERAKRDEALDILEFTRGGIIEAARRAAFDLFHANGKVSAPEVFALMRERGYEEALSKVDPRFMGAVFRSGSGWRRLGYENKGSHSRPVSVWTRRGIA